MRWLPRRQRERERERENGVEKAIVGSTSIKRRRLKCLYTDARSSCCGTPGRRILDARVNICVCVRACLASRRPDGHCAPIELVISPRRRHISAIVSGGVAITIHGQMPDLHTDTFRRMQAMVCLFCFVCLFFRRRQLDFGERHPIRNGRIACYHQAVRNEIVSRFLIAATKTPRRCNNDNDNASGRLSAAFWPVDFFGAQERREAGGGAAHQVFGA